MLEEIHNQLVLVCGLLTALVGVISPIVIKLAMVLRNKPVIVAILSKQVPGPLRNCKKYRSKTQALLLGRGVVCLLCSKEKAYDADWVCVDTATDLRSQRVRSCTDNEFWSSLVDETIGSGVYEAKN